jgi:ribosomal protein L12E/L44/L45/RPP1/RPP2
MKHVAAYALLVLGGTPVPEPEAVAALLKEAGVTADKEQIDALAAQFKGKGFHEIVAEGLAKISSSGPATSAPAAGGAAKPAAAKKESVKSESEENVEMGGLFGAEEDDY